MASAAAQLVPEEAISHTFMEFLGPMGAIVFRGLKRKGLGKDSIMAYIKSLQKNGVINEITAKNFSTEIEKCFAQ